MAKIARRSDRVVRFFEVRMGSLWQYLDLTPLVKLPGKVSNKNAIKEAKECLVTWREQAKFSCLKSCKWMYFCTLKRGHKGNHSEEGLLSWDDDYCD
jgi:hypothetical protein